MSGSPRILLIGTPKRRCAWRICVRRTGAKTQARYATGTSSDTAAAAAAAGAAGRHPAISTADQRLANRPASTGFSFSILEMESRGTHDWLP